MTVTVALAAEVALAASAEATRTVAVNVAITRAVAKEFSHCYSYLLSGETVLAARS